MSDEKKETVASKAIDGKLEKQVANMAFTIRKMKNWMEEKLGADIDGDGRVGSGPLKKSFILLLALGMSTFCLAENKTAIAYWNSTTYIDASGNMYANSFIGPVTATTFTASGALTAQSLTSRDSLAVGTNATIGGKLNVTGAISNTALTASKGLFTDSNKVLTSTGTLGVDQGGSGATNLMDHSVLVGSGSGAITPISVGTADQVLLGANTADPVFTTLTGDVTISGGKTVIGAGAITNENIGANADIAATKIAGTALTQSSVLTGEVTGVWNALVIVPDTIVDADINTAAGIVSTKLSSGVQISLGLADSSLQPNVVVTTGVTNGVDTAAITVTNGLGAASTIVGIWSAVSNGAASDANLTSIAATTGTLLSAADSPTIVLVTDSTGYAALTVTVSATSTNYAAFIQNNGVRKSSAEMVFDGP